MKGGQDAEAETPTRLLGETDRHVKELKSKAVLTRLQEQDVPFQRSDRARKEIRRQQPTKWLNIYSLEVCRSNIQEGCQSDDVQRNA
jgi:hypothetical protein